MKILTVLLFLVSVVSEACITSNGSFKISCHLSDDSKIKGKVVAMESMARRKEWLEASKLAGQLVSNCEGECLSCGDDLGIQLNAFSYSCLFNAWHGNPVIPEIGRNLLATYSNTNVFEFSPACSSIYRTLMAYYWGMGDLKNHDKVLFDLLLYDVDDTDVFITFCHAFIERPHNFASINAIHGSMILTSHVAYPLFLIFTQDCSGEFKFAELLKWLSANDTAGEEEMRLFSCMCMSLIGNRNYYFVSGYVKGVVAWLKSQKYTKSREGAISFAISEIYRMKAVFE